MTVESDQHAVSVFGELYASDDLELDASSESPGNSTAVVEAEGGVWVRCWRWISDDELGIGKEEE